MLLVVLGVTIDVTMGVLARRNLHDRLLAATSRADALSAAHTAPDLLAAELNGGGIRALVVTADGQAYGDRAISPDLAEGPVEPPPPYPPPYPPPAYPPPDTTATVVVHPLLDGARLILVADTTQTTQVTRQLRGLMIAAGIVTLLIAALLLIAVSRAALRPLDRLTALANAITTGDRGRRLRPHRADTELGRAASAFDTMLDALEMSERRAQQAARRAETATRRFLVDAAHELRTPIAGMQFAAEQLAHGASEHPDEAQYRRAGLLLSGARRAARLVNDMLDLSRIDAGLPLELHDVDVAAVLRDEADRAALLAPQIGVRRTGLTALNVRADATRLSQIVSNLLDNARRYTPAGGAAEITVTDTGPGIPDDEREHIFDRLVRLDAGRARDHGGDLVCLPHRGGARFRLTLPRATTE